MAEAGWVGVDGVVGVTAGALAVVFLSLYTEATASAIAIPHCFCPNAVSTCLRSEVVSIKTVSTRRL